MNFFLFNRFLYIHKFYNLLIVLFLFFLSAPAMGVTNVNSYFLKSPFVETPFLDTGNLLKSNKYEFAIHTQFVFKKRELDTNIIVYFDKGSSHKKDMNERYFIGYGESGFSTGYFLKWIPFPDYIYQPAVGISGGITYNNSYNNFHYVNIHFRPLVSKEFNTIIGKITSYISLPFSIGIRDLDLRPTFIRITIGGRGEVFIIHSHKIEFNFEISKELTNNNAVTYFSVGFITQLNNFF